MYMFNLCYKHTCVTDKLLLDLVAGHSQLQAYKWDARFFKIRIHTENFLSFKRFLELRKSLTLTSYLQSKKY